jgi:hypothetical protein
MLDDTPLNTKILADTGREIIKRENVSRLVKLWESRQAKVAARSGLMGLMAVSLAACGGSGDSESVGQDDLPFDPTDPSFEPGSLTAGQILAFLELFPQYAHLFPAFLRPGGVEEPDDAVISLLEDTGYSDSDKITSDGSLVISDEADGVGRVITYTRDGNPTVGVSGDGVYVVTVTDTNAGGSTVATFTFTLDTTKPEFAVDPIAGTNVINVEMDEDGFAYLVNNIGGAIVGTDPRSFDNIDTEHEIAVSAQVTVTEASIQIEDVPGNTALNDITVFLGTAGNDVITGTAGSDFIYGFGGNDQLLGDLFEAEEVEATPKIYSVTLAASYKVGEIVRLTVSTDYGLIRFEHVVVAGQTSATSVYNGLKAAIENYGDTDVISSLVDNKFSITGPNGVDFDLEAEIIPSPPFKVFFAQATGDSPRYEVTIEGTFCFGIGGTTGPNEAKTDVGLTALVNAINTAFASDPSKFAVFTNGNTFITLYGFDEEYAEGDISAQYKTIGSASAFTTAAVGADEIVVAFAQATGNSARYEVTIDGNLYFGTGGTTGNNAAKTDVGLTALVNAINTAFASDPSKFAVFTNVNSFIFSNGNSFITLYGFDEEYAEGDISAQYKTIGSASAFTTASVNIAYVATDDPDVELISTATEAYDLLVASGDLAADVLIGGDGSDIFIILSGDAGGENMLTAGVFDTIVGLNLGGNGESSVDKIALDFEVGSIVSSVFFVGGTLQDAVTVLFGADGFLHNQDGKAVHLTMDDGTVYLVIANEAGTVFGLDDVIVEITGYSGILDVNDFILASSDNLDASFFPV